MKAAVCVAATCLAALLAGCQPPPTASAAPAVPIAQDTPAQAATSLLRVLQAHLQARAAEQWTAADQYRDQALTSLLHRDDILARYHLVAGRTAKPDQEALQTLVENWAAAIAYYADDMRWEEAEAHQGREGDRAIVTIPVFAGTSRAVLQVAVARGADHTWRAIGLEFGAVAPPTSARASSTSPAATPPEPRP